MKKRRITILGALGLGLLSLREAEAQSADQAAFERALKQCQSAETAEQCKQALPMCEEAQWRLPKLAPGEQREKKEDGLLNDWAGCEKAVGRYADAEGHWRSLLTLRQRRYGPEHPEVAQSLNNLALVLESQGKYAEAETLHQKALALRQKLLGPEHPDVATSLNNLALVLDSQGKYGEAEMLLRKALALRQKLLGPEHPEVAQSLNNLAAVLHRQGKYAEAETLYQKSLALYQKRLGAEHPEVAQSLNNLAYVLSSQGKLAEAETLHQKALALRQKLLGPEHPDVALSLNNLAAVLVHQGKYAEAEALVQKALALYQKLLGPEHPELALSLNNLASVLENQGKYAEAETVHQKALAMYQKRLGPEHPDVALGLNNLAGVLSIQGKYAEAETLYQKALAISQKRLGPEHPDVAQDLNNLAVVLHRQGKYAEAETLHQKALALRQKRLGPEHPDVATSLNNLAAVLENQGKYADAETLHQKALALFQKRLGLEHPHIATSLNNLAVVLESQGKNTEAETLHQKALVLRQKLLGPDHPALANSLNKLAGIYLGRSRLAQALPFLRQAAAIRETQLRTTVSETRMQALLDTLRGEEDLTYGLLLHPELPSAKELALQVALLRKGRVAAAGAAANWIVQRSLNKPEIAQQFKDWQCVRQQHEALLFGGLGKLPLATYRERLQATKQQAEALEAQLVSALPELRSLQPPKLGEIIAQVAARLPARSALVEVLWTAPYQGKGRADGKEWGTPHYVALILFPDRRIATVDLGEAATVDTLGQELRTALASLGTDPVPAAQRLYGQVMQGLQAQLGDVRELYLSLDGTLNVIPFDALHDGTDYLLGRYRFHYLTSGRDLLRERSLRVPMAPLLLANPEFGQVVASTKEGDKSLYARLSGLPALPGALREAQTIAPLLGIQPLVGASAREEAVRGSAAPRILHIATHGLFLQDVQLAPPLPQSGEVRGVSLLQRERSKAVGVAEAARLPGALSTMNRSALVLADAARGASAQDAARDGILTADEARSLDLDGTQLVVLSACETGRGGLSAGQGVYGLRRAFLVAGAETLVTSLWRVSDAATGELMTRYYEKLLDKQKPGDRLGAMVEAMQEIRKKPGREHPYYWAPFLVIGQDGPLH